METINTFLTVIAWFGAIIGAFNIFLYGYADHQLNHTSQGTIRKAIAEMDGKTITLKSVGGYVILLVVSGAWIITGILS